MNNILNWRFISALAPDAKTTNNNISEYYAKFKEDLSELCRSNTDFSKLYLALMELQGILTYAKKQIKNSDADFYVSMASKLTDAELELLKIRISNPLLFESKNQASSSVLKWSDTFTKRDLIELLTALNAMSAITKLDGSSVSFVQLVKSVEQFLNIKLPRSYKTRESIVARKIKTTNFLTALCNVVIEKSEK